MNLNQIRSLSKVILSNVQTIRLLNTTNVRPLIQKWREERGLPLNPNAYGTLTDKADYTYLDGRPTPYGMRQKTRIMKQRAITQKIIDLSNEVDFAVERHKRMQIEASQQEQDILNSKLKPKGKLLLNK